MLYSIHSCHICDHLSDSIGCGCHLLIINTPWPTFKKIHMLSFFSTAHIMYIYCINATFYLFSTVVAATAKSYIALFTDTTATGAYTLLLQKIYNLKYMYPQFIYSEYRPSLIYPHSTYTYVILYIVYIR